MGAAKILGRQKSPEGADILFAVKCGRLKQGRSTSHFSLIRQEGSTGLQSICHSKSTEKSQAASPHERTGVMNFGCSAATCFFHWWNQFCLLLYLKCVKCSTLQHFHCVTVSHSGGPLASCDTLNPGQHT